MRSPLGLQKKFSLEKVSNNQILVQVRSFSSTVCPFFSVSRLVPEKSERILLRSQKALYIWKISKRGVSAEKTAEKFHILPKKIPKGVTRWLPFYFCKH